MLFKSGQIRPSPLFLVLFALLVSHKVEAKVIGGAILQGTSLEDGSTSLKITGHKAIKWSGSKVDPLVFDHTAANPTRLMFKEDGDYFIALTAPIIEGQGINGGIRTSQEFVVFKNGTEVPESTGSSTYIRHASGHAESSGHVHFLLTEVESDDYVEVMTRRTTTNMTNDTLMQTTSLYVEQIGASRVAFSGTATQTVGGTNLNGNASSLQWTAGRNDDGFTHDSHEITLDTEASYLVFANIPLKGAVARGSVALEVKLDGERIPGGLAQQGYIRNADGGTEASIHWAGLVFATEGQKLTIDTVQKAAGGTITVPPGNAASIFIEKLADPTDLFTASATQVVNNSNNWNPGEKTAIQWETSDAFDTDVYAHLADAEPNKIMVKKAGDYLLLYNDALKDGSARGNPRVTVQLNGEDVDGAESKSHYNRKGSGHDESSTSLVFLLEGLSIDDTLTVSVQREGAGGTVNDEVPALLTLLWRPKLIIPNPIPTIQVIGDLEPPLDVAPVPVTVTFNVEGEDTVVSGFDQDDVIVTGADLSNFSGSGHTYTFIVTPTAEAGQVTVSIPAGSATDGTHDSFAGFLAVDYARFFSITRMDDLVGWWSFDDDTANDKSGNDHHGVASATDIYSEDTAFGRGKSINLNGDKYITVSDGGVQSTFDGGSVFSVSFWAKEWPDGSWEPYVSKRGEGGQGWQIRRRGNTGDQIAFTLRGPGNDDWSPTRNINDDQWHHLAATWGGGKRVLYVDGAQVGSENRGGNVNPTGSQLVFGARDNSGNANNQPSIGNHSNAWLDDIRFYRASLTEEDVASIYNNGDGDFNDPPVITLVGEAHLRVPAGTDFVDPGATAIDTEDGDLSDISVIVLGDADAVDTARVGDWKLFYMVKDSAGASASITRTIRIFDPGAPVLTLNGDAQILHEATTKYIDAGATVVDQDGNTLDVSQIEVTGLPSEETPSEDFVVTYDFKDDQDRAAETIIRTVKVVDTRKPEVTIVGDAVIHHQVGAVYVDKGANATDTLDGELVATDSLFTANQLELSGWLIGGRSDGLVDLDENGGILTLSPVGSTLFNDQVYFDGDASFRAALPQINRNDDFQIVLSGYFQALSAGDYEFGTEIPDDRSSFWIDLDGDGVFSTDGLKGNERTTQADAIGGYSIVSLDPGFYKVAMAYSEHAGGARFDALYRIVTETPSARERINPGDPGQAGQWGTGKPVNIYQEGTYTINYTATDAAGNIGTAQRTVIVEYIPGAPIITLKGDAISTHEGGTAFVDPGARLRDSQGVPLDHSQIVTANVPDGNVLGDFFITYNFTDANGQAAPEILRKVTVVDTTAPSITLNGEAEMEIIQGADFTDPGVTFDDTFDGNPNLKKTSTNPFFDPGLLGGFVAGNLDATTTNPGNVGVNPLGPTASEQTGGHPWADNRTIIYTGQIYDTDGKISFMENIDDKTWLKVGGKQVLDDAGWNVMTQGAVDAGQGGWFNFELRISNGGGGAGKVGDMGFGFDPAGGADFILPRNSSDKTADLFRFLADPASFDTGKLGSHTLTYTVNDSSGNASTVSRTVVVIPSPTIPLITLEGENDVTHEAGEIFTDPGYSIKDASGNLLPDEEASVGGDFDPSIPGSYTVTYDYTDGEGNEALQVSRKVTVSDTRAPTVMLDGDAVIKIEVGSTYSDPGFSATDIVDGDIPAFSNIEYFPNSLDVSGYMEGGRDINLLNFDQDGGLLSIDPVGVSRFSGDITSINGDGAFRAIIPEVNKNDDYQFVFHGFFLAQGDGDYEFGIDNADDRCCFWIDLDQDGVFESDGDYGNEVIFTNFSGGGWKTHNLADGFYRVAIGFMEFGGGAWVRPRVRLPGGGRLGIHPSNATQNGYWFTSPTATLDVNTPGSYTIEYSAFDSSGNLGKASRIVNVVHDATAPSIVLLGDPVVTHEVGQEYTDAGGNIADGDGILMDGEKATVNVDDLDTGKPGTYLVTLSYASADGSEVTPVKRTVNVVDTTPPTLVLKGEAELKLLVGDIYDIMESPGATFSDNFDPDRDVGFGMPPSGIPGLALHLDASSPGENYQDGDVMNQGMSDLSGKDHHADNIFGNPTWKAEGLNGRPTISFDGDDMIWTSKDFEPDLANHTLLTLARYSGGDNERVISTRGRNWLFGFHGNNTGRWYAGGWIYNNGVGDTEWHLHIGDINNKDQANFWKDGVQLATNSTGANNNTYKPRVIQLGGWEGSNEMSKCEVSEVILFDRVIDDGERNGLVAYLVDKYQLNVPVESGRIDTSAPGTHEFVYTASDSSGNTASVTRTIIVEEDNDPPVITLAGDAVMYITPGTEFIDPGVTATDRGKEIPVGTSTTFPKEQLLALYAFNDPANPGFDSSSNSADAEVRGGVTSTAEGRFGAGIELNGTDAFLLTPLDGHHNVDFSWTAWIKTTDGNGGIVGISQDNWSQGGKGVYISGGRPKIDVGWVGNGMGAAILNDGEWHHVALTVKESGGNADPYIIYVDGEVNQTANIDWFRFDGTGHDLRIGHIGIDDGQFLAGTLDDVAIYQKILSQEEIQEMMQGATVIDTNVSAAYPLTYTATDLAGNQTSVTRIIVVTDDPGIPYIALNGPVESVIEFGSDYADPGAKAYDKAGQLLGDLTATEVPDGKTLGEFEIVYAFKDASGKDALPAKRTLQVIDTTSPVVTLNESAEFGGTDLVTFKAGQTFVDPGVTTDDLDVATEMIVTHKISPDAWFTFDDEVNPGMDVTENGWDGQFYNMAARSEEGRYGAGLLISSLDSNSRFEIPGNGFPLKSEWTATAWFKKLYPTGRWRTLFRGKNTDHQVMFSNNSDLLGNYANGRGDFQSSGYSLTPDESKAWRHIAAVGTGNETRFYMDGQFVGASDQKGINTIWRIGNWPGNQHFAKYIDDVMLFNRALSEQEIAIAKGGNQPFDTTKPGAYSLLYTVTDSSGNTSQAFRTVVVEEDNSAPVITLIGKPEVTHEAGEEYRDNGAFVSTADGEPLLNEGLKTETDLASLPGTYSFTYTFTDEKGSVAIPATRSIRVIDTSGPVITLVGASPITLPRGEVYDDPGALAEDNVDGVVPVQVAGMTQPYVALDIGPLGQRVQDGWIGISGGNNDQDNVILPSEEVVTPDGHTFTIQISSVDWRDRGDSTSSAPLARVAEDFVKNNAGDITLTLTGLPEGDYVFTTYHLDALNAQSEQINVHVTDANGQDVLQGGHGNANQNPGVNGITEGSFTNTSANFQIKSNGVDPVVVRLDGQVPDTEVPINALVIETPVVISAVGEYLLTYSARDSLGHRSEITRTVIVSDDATIPTITLVGDKEINLEAGNAFEDPGTTLTDRDGNDLDSAPVQVSGKVLPSVPGIYVLAYDYADADGKAAVTRKRTVIVGDNTAPVITLNGAATIVHPLGEPYQDAGAAAVDSVSGLVEVTDSFNFYSNGLIAHWNFEDLTDDIARDLVSGQDGVIKQFDLVTDHIDGIRGKALNFDGVDNRIDVPVLGRNPSEFTVSAWLLRRNGNASSIFHTKGWAAGDLHFIVQNDINFAFNGMGQQSGGGGNDFRSIDPLKLNEWTHVAVAYSLNAKEAQIYIDGELLRETTFTGTRRIMLKDGIFIGAGQNGTDRFLDGALDEVAIYDRALTSSQVRAVMSGGQAVDVRTEGQYTINFIAQDASGNKATATRTVIVTADPDAPVITLLGNSEIAHEAGNPFEDPGANVADKDGNDLDATSIVVGGEVKSDTLGQYTLTYDFTDAAGGKAMQILRKVSIADTLAPVITLIGDKETRIGINAVFTDPGATAKDLFEGDIQVQATIPIPIDTTAAGDFEIIYTATDTIGNKAEVKRAIKVLPDTTPPVITLVGESTMTINLGSEYDEDGAIAEDNIDGILTPFLEDSGTVDAVDTSKEGTYVITYDVTDSAGNKAVQVTRTVIVKSSDAFDNWLEALPVGQRAPDDDPDKDGVSNLLEFALGGNPAIADRAIVMPSFDPSGGSLKLTFIHLKESIDPNLNYMPEITSSLKVSWSPEGLTTRGALQGVPQDNLPDGKPFATSDYARATVTADTSMAEAGSKQFLRLTVSRE